MLRYLVRRILLTIPVLLGVATLVFSLIHLVPGDPAQAMLGDGASPQDIAELRVSLGLDRPLLDQYVTFLRHAVTGDLGKSFRTGQPVTTMIIERLPATAELAIAAMIVAILIAIPLGVIAAVWRGTRGGLRRHDVRPGGRFHSELLAGPAPRDRVRGGAWLAAGIRPRHARPPGAAGGVAGPRACGHPRAHDAREPARRAARALRPRGAGPRRVARLRDCRSRTQEQHGAAAHHHRAAVRRRADRRGDHRDDFRLARHRTFIDSVDWLPRLPDGAGLHPADRGDLCHGQPGDRSACTACSTRGFASNDPSTGLRAGARRLRDRRARLSRGPRRAVAAAMGCRHAGFATSPAGSDVAALVWARRVGARHPGARAAWRAGLVARRFHRGRRVVDRRHDRRRDFRATTAAASIN